MPRLLLNHKSMLRHLVSINVRPEGSIIISLVRDGTSESGFRWEEAENGLTPLEKNVTPEEKTKKITIHTSGRINYHFGEGGPYYVPCLLDLEASIPILRYSVPYISKLDKIIATRKDDHIIEISEEHDSRINFSFSVLPAVFPQQKDEGGRLVVEGLYALSWSVYIEDSGAAREEVPDEVFITRRPLNGLPKQAIREEVVFLRFRKEMYANDVILAAKEAPNSGEITAEHIEAAIQVGPGLSPPNSEGIWTMLASVPMRIAPRLDVSFDDPRYRADVVELRPADTRLSTVRVRFKVFDEKSGKYVKERVAINRIALHADL